MARSASESQNECESAKNTQQSPNAATHTNSVRPAFRSFRCARTSDITTAPAAGAARSTPSPSGPTRRMSEAKIGRSAGAPPNSTEKRSSTCAPRSSGCLRRKRIPTVRFSAIDSSSTASAGVRVYRTRAKRTKPIAQRTVSAAYGATARPPEKPYSSPPTAGPTTAANCQSDDRHATAFAYVSRGTISAPSAVRAGCRNERTRPLANTTA